jgi:hypothetical protein
MLSISWWRVLNKVTRARPCPTGQFETILEGQPVDSTIVSGWRGLSILDSLTRTRTLPHSSHARQFECRPVGLPSTGSSEAWYVS